MAESGLEVGRILLDFVIVILAAKIGGEIFERLKQPAVIGELLAGLVVGPTLFGVIPNVHDPFVADAAREGVILFVAELGAILLLFEVGLESNLSDLVKVGRSASAVALIGIVASVALGFAASFALARVGWFPDDPLFHLFVGATFAATSVGITARVFQDVRRLATPEARIILGAAVLDDVGGLLVLALVAGLASAAATGGSLDAIDLAVTAAKAIVFLAASFLAGTRLVPPLFARIATLRARGVVMAFAFLFAFLMAWLADLAGLATIVGAFSAGIILSQAKQRDEIFAGVKPLGFVFIPFFFVVLGAAVNLRDVGGDVARVAVATLALLVLATLAKLACGWGVRKGEADRLVVGVGMVPRGEVGLIFVLFGIGHLGLETWIAVTLILVVMLTTVVTPLWLRRLFRRLPDAPPALERMPGEGRDEVGARSPKRGPGHP